MSPSTQVFDALQLQNAGLAAARDALSVLTQQMEASRGAKQTLALEQTLAAAMSQS